MKNLRFEIVIRSPAHRVWEIMQGEETYGQWAEVFAPGSHFSGSWSAGADIAFLAPDKNGELSGLLARVKASRLYEFVSIEYIGETVRGQDRFWAAEQHLLENYTMHETNGVTRLIVETQAPETSAGLLGDLWPKALERLKFLSEHYV